MVGAAAHISLQDKALGALLGGALGDALGMPTQTLTADQISALYGRIDDLAPSHPDNSVSRGLPAGAITDDTEQTLLMAEQLISSPDHFDNHQWAQTLLEWERDVRARGLYDMLGPSTKRALSALIDGAPVDEVGKNGTTNGAAMRVSPIALATPAYPIEALIEEVEKSCRLTHNTPQAIAGAAAVAAALSIALDGASLEKMIEHAQAAAQLRGAEMANRISWAVENAPIKDGHTDWLAFADEVGCSSETIEAVPMAFAVLKASNGNAWKAGLISANLYDDTDTIGAIAAGMAGALNGASSLPKDKIELVITTNSLNLDTIVKQLLKIRNARQSPTLERAI